MLEWNFGEWCFAVGCKPSDIQFAINDDPNGGYAWLTLTWTDSCDISMLIQKRLGARDIAKMPVDHTAREHAANTFLTLLQAEAITFNKLVSTESGEWVVKGFIDICRRIYTISADTKVVSKLIELMLFPHFVSFAEKHNLKLVLAREQNHYPDLTFIDENGFKYAVDLKSTYRISYQLCNTMTLGAFTGYFRNRESNKNVTFPYGEYAGHFVLGVIYSRSEGEHGNELKVYGVDDLENIPSVVRDLEFFAQPKYRIAKDQPGSGNTKNIGAVSKLDDLLNGTGPFAKLGEAVFDDYWMFYLTRDMARAAELGNPPYTTLASYLVHKRIPPEQEAALVEAAVKAAADAGLEDAAKGAINVGGDEQ